MKTVKTRIKRLSNRFRPFLKEEWLNLIIVVLYALMTIYNIIRAVNGSEIEYVNYAILYATLTITWIGYTHENHCFLTVCEQRDLFRAQRDLFIETLRYIRRYVRNEYGDEMSVKLDGKRIV
ncbi:hypothetical protein G1C95_1106 [Bifidobacterium sp. DSM 109957]|uniref:Uncharacterized protein n=1 Tax=Bifidobacterium oedipodis TaxID=2675322 RepID=A0A7Y0HTP9_9BIFI|nr:hypothetical protein [Bifidobacterium sp. DSM 109957]